MYKIPTGKTKAEIRSEMRRDGGYFEFGEYDNFTSRPFFHAQNTPANNTLYRELTATIDGSFSAWATSGVVQPPY